MNHHHLNGSLSERLLNYIITIIKNNKITNDHFLFNANEQEHHLVKQYLGIISDLNCLIKVKQCHGLFLQNNHGYLSQVFYVERNRFKDVSQIQWLKALIDRVNVYEEYFSYIQRLQKFIQQEGKSAYCYIDNDKYRIFNKETSQFLVQLFNSQYDLLQSKNLVFELLSWQQINIELSPADPLAINLRKIFLLIGNLIKQIYQHKKVLTRQQIGQHARNPLTSIQQENLKLKDDLRIRDQQNKYLKSLLMEKDKIQIEEMNNHMNFTEQLREKAQKLVGQVQIMKGQMNSIKSQREGLQQSINKESRQELNKDKQTIKHLQTRISQLKEDLQQKEQKNQSLTNYTTKLQLQNSNLDKQNSILTDKFLLIEQKNIRLQQEYRSIKNSYAAIIKKTNDNLKQSIVQVNQKRNNSEIQLLQCKVDELTAQNNLFTIQLNQLKEQKVSIDQELNNYMLQKDEINRQYQQSIKKITSNYQIQIAEKLANMKNNQQMSHTLAIKRLEQQFIKQRQILKHKLYESQVQRQEYRDKYQIEINKVLKRQMLNQSRFTEKGPQSPGKQVSYNLINVLDNTIIQIFQPLDAQQHNKTENHLEYSNILQDIQNENNSHDHQSQTSIIKDVQNSIRKKLQKSHLKIRQENQLFRSEMEILQTSISILQSDNKQLIQKIKFLQMKLSQLSDRLGRKQEQIHEYENKLKIMMKSNQDYQTQLNHLLQNKASTKEYHRPQLVHLQELLFYGDIFSSSSSHFKSRLINHVEAYVSSRIVKTNLLYKFDAHNKTNFHLYIDEKEYFLCLIKTSSVIIAGFYPGRVSDKKSMTEGGLLISLKKDKSFPLKVNKGNDKTNYKGMLYDRYYIIFGNAQLRIKTGQKKLFSNFGITSGFYDYQDAPDRKLDYFLQNGQDKECQFESYECYQLFFDEKITLKARIQSQGHNIYKNT